MPDETVLFSAKQALEWDDYSYEVPLDRVELAIQNGHPVLRLVLNETGFKRDVTSLSDEDSLKNTYGTEENNHDDAMKNFSDQYYQAFQKDGIKCFRESDSLINIFLPDDLDQALEIVKKLNGFYYRGNIKSYDSYHGEEYPEATRITVITRDDELPTLLQKHWNKLKDRVDAPICDTVRIINDGNAVVGVSKFSSVTTPNPQAADASVYAVAFFPKSPEQLDLLNAAILKAAHYMPDYYDEFVRPKHSEKQERFYQSPSYYLTGKGNDISLEQLIQFRKQNEGDYTTDEVFEELKKEKLAARDNYITKQDGFVLLREINLHDLKNLFKELETLNLIEPNQHIAAELYHAANSEYRGPIKTGQYDQDQEAYQDQYAGIFPDSYYRENTLENYDFSADSLKLDGKTHYTELVELFKQKIANTVRLQRFDAEAGKKSTRELFVSLYSAAQMSVDGKLSLIDGEGNATLPAVKTGNEATKLQLVKSRFEQLMHDVFGFKKGQDLDAVLQSFSKEYNDQRVEEGMKRYHEKHEKFMEEWRAKGGMEGMLKELDAENTYQDGLDAANRSEAERAGVYQFQSNTRRVKNSESLIVRNAALPDIPYFDKRSALSNDPVNFIPTTNTHTDYISKKPGENLFDEIDLDQFHTGLNAQLQEYLASAAQKENKKQIGRS